VEFVPQNNPLVTSNHWRATTSLLDGEIRTFDHVTLVGLSQGVENVHTYVEASWRERINNSPIISETVTHGIQVKVL
jgi:hypothetical protein